jgi:hypothetical protein
LVQTEQALAAAKSAADAATKELAALQQYAQLKAKAVNSAQQALSAAQQDEAAKNAALVAAERLHAEKAGIEQVASAAHWLADFVKNRLGTIKNDADAALYSRMDSARGAASTFLTTGLERDRVLAERSAALVTTASREAEVALPPLTAAVTAWNLTRATAEKATAERVAADAPLPALRQAASAATAAVPNRRNELNVALAAKAAADKSVVDKTPILQSLVAKVQALQSDAEALAAEKRATDNSKRVASITGL